MNAVMKLLVPLNVEYLLLVKALLAVHEGLCCMQLAS